MNIYFLGQEETFRHHNCRKNIRTFLQVTWKQRAGREDLYQKFLTKIGSFLLANDYWQKYTKNVKDCHLSSTNGRSGAHDTSEGFKTISIPFSMAKELHKFSGEHSIGKDIVIRTAWSLVLWRFTDLEEVCFSVHDRRRGDTVSGVCRISINSEDTLAALLGRAQDDAAQSCHYQINLLPEMVSTRQLSKLKDICNSAIVRIDEKGQINNLGPTGVCTLESFALWTNIRLMRPSMTLQSALRNLQHYSSSTNHRKSSAIWHFASPKRLERHCQV